MQNFDKTSWLPYFKNNSPYSRSSFVRPRRPRRKKRFPGFIYPSFQKSPPLGFQFHDLDTIHEKPPEIRIANVNELGQTIEEKIEKLRAINKREVSTQTEEIEKQEDIATSAIDLLQDIEDLSDSQIRLISSEIEDLKVSENPENEGLPRFIDSDYLIQNTGSKEAVILYILNRTKNSGGDVTRPIRGVNDDRNISIRDAFANLTRFNHVIDLREGKMVHSMKKLLAEFPV